MEKFNSLLILGLAHGAADSVTGFLLGSLPQTMATLQLSLLILLFNALAFGSQPALGFIADRIRRPRLVALIGLALHAVSILCLPYQIHLAVILAGMGSAAFHVGGGALAVSATQGKAIGPGIFAAPGVAGVAIGGALAVTGQPVGWLFLLLLGILGLGIQRAEMPDIPYSQQPSGHGDIFEGHDLIMLVLLLAIALRSAIWTTYQFLLQGDVSVLVLLGVAAAIGKLLGGIIGDRIGWRQWAVSALTGSTLLLTLAPDQLWALTIGLALLQSATPIAMAATAQLIPANPGIAAGLTLGFAIILGGIPPMLGFSPMMGSPPVVTLIALAAAGTLWWAIQAARPRRFTI
ncbi:MAG: MFS transporter [Chloroflexi bacterium]|nr:MFS transporter [Chloroflexota bacterium]